MPGQPKTREQFAEFYVAALFADAGWNVYFPRWDNGFDFIIERNVSRGDGTTTVIRPIQVRGKYPTEEKGDTRQYGIRNGLLSRVHPNMIVAIPFFAVSVCHPTHVAYLPWSRIRGEFDAEEGKHVFSCFPAGIRAGKVYARQEYLSLFDNEGMAAVSSGIQNDVIASSNLSAEVDP